jgi:hypothetical protein
LDELPIRHLTEENKSLFMNGNRFEITLPEAGTRIVFRMLLGEDEEQLARLRQRSTEIDLFDLIGFRVVEIEDVTTKDKRKFIDDLSVADADFMIDEFDRVDEEEMPGRQGGVAISNPSHQNWKLLWPSDR